MEFGIRLYFRDVEEPSHFLFTFSQEPDFAEVKKAVDSSPFGSLVESLFVHEVNRSKADAKDWRRRYMSA
jgi:hypothetical protein